MPKTDIDYSNTIIYKITCKDKSIKDVYVGYTTNFVQRKHAHKQSCINNKSAGYTCKLYEVIRANGGWNNWQMEIINFFDCKDQYEARIKEQEYCILLNATLNSIEPFAKAKCVTPKEKHVTINGNDTAETNWQQKVPEKFECLICDYKTSRHSQYDRHLSTGKHLMATESTHLVPKKSHSFKCDYCSKKYKDRSGLWKHAKSCTLGNEENITISTNTLNTSSNEMKVLTNLVLEMVKSNNDLQKQNTEIQKQNNDLQKKVLEVCNNSNNTINSNNNSHNKTFNLQFFLNEQCKDAMNISDFANSITLELSDLESVGELGYVEGITKIMLDKLNSMDIYKRPIHCSDAKREILYVKDHDVWEKEERNNPKLRYAIKTISFNNMKLMGLWSSTYPESLDGESYLNDKYMKLIKQSTGGNGEISDSEDKIIRRIAKEIVIGKNKL